MPALEPSVLCKGSVGIGKVSDGFRIRDRSQRARGHRARRVPITSGAVEVFLRDGMESDPPELSEPSQTTPSLGEVLLPEPLRPSGLPLDRMEMRGETIRRMKVSVLDDYFDTLRTLRCFEKLAGHVTVWNDHVQAIDALAERLRECEALVLIRERTQIRTPLLERLPALRLISQRSVHPHINVDTCTRLGIGVSSSQHLGIPSYAAAELTWGLVLAAMRQIPQQMMSLRGGGVADGRRRLGARQDARDLRLWPDRHGRGGIRPGLRHEDPRVGTRTVAGSSARGRLRHRPEQTGLLEACDVMRLVAETRGIVTAADLGRIKPTALFVNTSRAQLIARGALIRALQAGRPGMAAIDVYEDEPLRDASHPLLRMDNVVCTPHIGYVSKGRIRGAVRRHLRSDQRLCGRQSHQHRQPRCACTPYR